MRKKLFHKDFTLVVIGQIISLFAGGILRFALPLYLLKETGSPTLFGIASALSFIPMIILTPIGGIIADRANKRNIMVVLDFSTTILMLLFFLLLDKVNLSVLIIITLMFIYGILGAYQPTVQASIPLLHDKENLLLANSIINQVSAFANLLAPILGGLLFGFWGIVPIVLVGICCFFISAVMEIFITIPHTRKKEKEGVLQIIKQDFSDSLSFMKNEKPVILKSIWISFGFNLFLGSLLIVSMPVIITQTLEMSDKLYGYSQGALAAGGLFGGILVGVFAKKLSIKNIYLMLFTASILLLPIALSLWLGLSPFVSYLIMSISCFFVISLASGVTIQILTFIQSETPVNLTGKVLSLTMALSMCAQPFGQAMYGFLFDVFKKTPYFIFLITLIISAVIAVFSKNALKDL